MEHYSMVEITNSINNITCEMIENRFHSSDSIKSIFPWHSETNLTKGTKETCKQYFTAHSPTPPEKKKSKSKRDGEAEGARKDSLQMKL